MAAAPLKRFFFDVEKWRGSKAVARMSFAERGVYLEMMLEQWLRGCLPDDAEAVAGELAITPNQHAEVVAAWPTVRKKFVTRGHQIINLPLESVRKEQQRYLETKRASGMKGGQASAASKQRNNINQENKLQPSTAQAVVDQRLSSAEALSTDLIRSDLTRSDLIRPDQPSRSKNGSARVNGRSKRPIFAGQRLTVFDWMLEDIMQTLGSHTDAFDIHGWLDELDRKALTNGAVMPKHEQWNWIQAELLSEVHRRGLPLARNDDLQPVSSKHTQRLAVASAGFLRANK